MAGVTENTISGILPDTSVCVTEHACKGDHDCRLLIVESAWASIVGNLGLIKVCLRTVKMTLMEFFGCSLIAFGPPVALFSITVAKDPIRIIILISAAFFWLLSLLLSSILWFAVVPLQKQLAFGVVFSVLFQETFRFIFYKILRKAEVGLKKVEEVGMEGVVVSTNRSTLAYVAGLGFGVMSGAFSLVNVLADSVGPGTVGLHDDSPYFFIISAFTTLAFILLHTFWGVIYFHAWDLKNYLKISYVVISHLTVSCLTLLNKNQMYWASIAPLYLFLFISGGLAFKAAGGSLRSLRAFFICTFPN